MAFAGFPKETARFLAGIRQHNDKAWFDAHRADYERAFLAPAQAFVEALGPRLRKIDPAVQAQPGLNGSILRINRDVRFSKDKSPYKDHLDLWFWTGEEKGWDCSGFFFRLTADRLLLGAGMHGFVPPMLARYRAAVLDPKRGAALVAIVAKLRKAGYEVGTERYKKPPRGVAADHLRAALLRHGGLHAGWEGKHPPQLGSAGLVGFVAGHFAKVAPLHAWLGTI
jgi:uncharacterized protein (TIGR02453 family)